MKTRVTLRRSPDAEQNNPNFVHALAKGLEILSTFSSGRSLGNQELVALTGLPKATVSRLTSTLVELGYLRIDAASRKLLMGTRVLGMGATVQREIGLQRVARTFMENLSREVGLTVSLATRDRLGMVFLEVARPPAQTRLVTNTDVGSVLPLANTSIGLAYIVGATVKERSLILQGLSRRHPQDWPMLRHNIERAHEDYQRLGFVVTQRAWGRDVNAVGIPLTLPERKALYAFHCAGPSSQLPLVRLKREVGPRLRDMVGKIRDTMQQPAMLELLEHETHQP